MSPGIVRTRTTLACAVYLPFWIAQLTVLYRMTQAYFAGNGTELWLAGIVTLTLFSFAIVAYVIRATVRSAGRWVAGTDFAGDVFGNVLISVGLGLFTLFWFVIPFTYFS